VSGPGAQAWPQAVFNAPVLRRIDAHGRSNLMSAGRLHQVGPGAVFYTQNDTGDSFFVVASGTVTLSAVRRGAEAPAVVRVARVSETFGDEATLPGRVRRMTAVSAEPAVVAEIPVTVYQRAVGRSGTEVADQEQRILQRRATLDLLRTMAFTAELPESDLGLVLDAIRYETFDRGEHIYHEGDPAARFYLIASGLVQLQTEDDEHVHVRAYLTTGDFFGDDELLDKQPRAVAAVAMGACHVMSMSALALQTLADRNPGVLGRLRRISIDRQASQQAVVAGAAANTTRHVFKDLYRMQMARSLLTIDQDTCVRCGHCAWSCASMYGVARLVRRGDKVVTRVGTDAADKTLLIPNSCQHCKNPVCMIDCPTGAIGRDPHGEVFIREELCTGCGSCAKACPWENIRMAPRPATAPIAQSLRQSVTGSRAITELFAEVAVKCDLCRSYDAPACVQSCPTGAIMRLEPAQDFHDVARMLGGEGRRGGSSWRVGESLVVGIGLMVVSASTVLSLGLHARGQLSPASGLGYVGGWIALALMLLLAAYALPKRLVRLWMRLRRTDARAQTAAAAAAAAKPARPKSRVRPFYLLHLALGLVVPGAVAMHTGLSLPPGRTGALQLALWATVLAGLWGAFVYRAIPRRLARLERTGALPEDLARERDNLVDRLYRGLSGRSELVKQLADKILLPYSSAPMGSLALLVSGRSLRQEEERLRRRVDEILQGRGVGRTAGLDDVVRIVVEMRALPLRRWLTGTLRGWLATHVILGGILLALMLVHVAEMLLR
jgi:Fe-S-cluster-containing dehydrogenase component/CRP-like cAMP-binding protein